MQTLRWHSMVRIVASNLWGEEKGRGTFVGEMGAWRATLERLSPLPSDGNRPRDRKWCQPSLLCAMF
jgi:hypothetical protein